MRRRHSFIVVIVVGLLFACSGSDEGGKDAGFDTPAFDVLGDSDLFFPDGGGDGGTSPTLLTGPNYKPVVVQNAAFTAVWETFEYRPTPWAIVTETNLSGSSGTASVSYFDIEEPVIIETNGTKINAGMTQQVSIPKDTVDLILDLSFRIEAVVSNPSRNDKFYVDLSDVATPLGAGNTIQFFERSQLDEAGSLSSERFTVTFDEPWAATANRQLRVYVLGGTVAAGRVKVHVDLLRLTARLCSQDAGECG